MGDVQSVRCARHTLQLCINAALEQEPICGTAAAAQHLVGHFNKGDKAKTGQREKQEQQNVPQRELIQDVSTRWSSTCLMSERLLEQRRPVTAVLSDPNFTQKSEGSTLDLTAAQWSAADRLSAGDSARGSAEPPAQEEEEHVTKKQRADKDKELVLLPYGDEEDLVPQNQVGEARKR